MSCSHCDRHWGSIPLGLATDEGYARLDLENTLIHLISPVGSSTFSWMGRLDSGLVLPDGWGPPHLTQPGAPDPDREVWRRRLRAEAAGPHTCAELDSIRRWLASRTRRDGRDVTPDVTRLTLVVTHLDHARWAADVLRPCLAELLPKVERIEVVDLDLSAMNLAGGLRELVRTFGVLVKQARPHHEPVLNATPGFKAESALLTLVGAILQAEVFYLHEGMEQAVRMPAIPLTFDVGPEAVSVLAELGDVASSTDAVHAQLHRHPELWPFVAEDDGLWGVNALGELLLAHTAPADTPVLPDYAGDFAIGIKSTERGHAPHDWESLGRDIRELLPFAHGVRVTGWEGQANRREGVLVPRPGDVAHGIIRIRLASSDSKAPLLRYAVSTGTTTETAWREARRLAIDAFGGLAVEEQVTEALGLDASGFAALADLDRAEALEAALLARLEDLEAEKEVLAAQVAALKARVSSPDS